MQPFFLKNLLSYQQFINLSKTFGVKMPKSVEKNKTTVTFNEEMYDFESLSQECKITVAKLTRLEQEFSKLAYEIEKLEVFKNNLMELMRKQLPEKSLGITKKSNG